MSCSAYFFVFVLSEPFQAFSLSKSVDLEVYKHTQVVYLK